MSSKQLNGSDLYRTNEVAHTCCNHPMI